MNGLILHVGAGRVDREDLNRVSLPPRTHSWVPVHHGHIVDLVLNAIQTSTGYEVVEEVYGLSKDKMNMFSLIGLAPKKIRPAGELVEVGTEPPETLGESDFLTENRDDGDPKNPVVQVPPAWDVTEIPGARLVLGIRNSHKKMFPAGLVAGSNVMVCDNLCFRGEVTLARKHTAYIMEDLPAFTSRAIGKLGDVWMGQKVRYEKYKEVEMSKDKAYSLFIEAVKMDIITCRSLPLAVNEWDSPRHPDHGKGTAWTFFSAATEAMKGNIIALPRRGLALHGLLDGYCGIGQPVIEMAS